MLPEVIYKSNFICISKSNSDYIIQSYSKGLSMQEFNKIISQYNKIKITDFNVIKRCLLKAPQSFTKFGEEKKRFTIETSQDLMKAYLTISVDPLELTQNKDLIISSIKALLKNEGIIYGINLDYIAHNNDLLVNDKRILIAQGKSAINGSNSAIKIKFLNKSTPIKSDSGNVNYFEIDLITKITKEDWLGEWTKPTNGVEGYDIKGVLLKPIAGKNIPISYDKRSIRADIEEGITILYANKSGALDIQDDKLFVLDFLEIDSDVDYTTGNIEFDGSVLIKGTVKDSFSVIATKDIEILSKFGVSGANKIISKQGNILIQGGLNGQNKTLIEAEKNITVKFLSESNLSCKGSLNVNSYILNSNIDAREVIIESSKGQLIGGKTRAITRLISPIIGSSSEQSTSIFVKCISKNKIKDAIFDNFKKMESYKSKLMILEKDITSMKSKKTLTKDDNKKLYNFNNLFINLKMVIRTLELDSKNLTKDLTILGFGEVIASNICYPNVSITMDDVNTIIYSPIKNPHFYFIDGEIKQK